MRFGYVLFAVLICSNLHAQNKNDVTFRPPPPPTEVSVLNFPDVQAVGGSVNVGNLPLDADGAVRVTSAPARQMVWYELVSEPLVSGPPNSNLSTTYLLQPIDTTGFSSFAVWVRDSSSAQISWGVEARWVADEDFMAVSDHRSGNNFLSMSGGFNGRHLYTSMGGEIRVRLTVNTDFNAVPTTVRSLRVYLFP